MINVSWVALKGILTARTIGLQFVEDDYKYFVFAIDGPVVFACDIIKADPATSEQADFEENFKEAANKKIEPIDSEGCKIQRQKFNPSGWHFEPRILKFSSGVHKSLHNKKFDAYTIAGCSDIGDATLKFFNSSGTELTQGESETDEAFQTRLDENCTTTCCDWQATYDQEIISAMFNVKDPPSANSAYAWCIIAPDIPANLGGSVPFIEGGIDLSFAADKCCVKIDGRVSKRLNYDPIYNTNKVRLVITHSLATHVALQIIFEHFKA